MGGMPDPSRRPARKADGRYAWVLLHRYAGLATALFLAVAGITGSILAFGADIDAWLNPQWYRVASQGPALGLDELAGRIEAADPRVQVDYITHDRQAGRSAFAFVSPRAGSSSPAPDYDQVFIDPVSGKILGVRSRSGCCLQAGQFVPFVLAVHHSLFLPGKWGWWFMGGVAVVWFLDCFVGAVLTLPRGRPLLRKWLPAWRIKRGAGGFRLNLDLHRAAGLWLWGLLLALAFSSIYLNLKEELVRPVVARFSPLSSVPASASVGVAAPPKPGFEAVRRRADAEARRRGWGHRTSGVSYFREQGLYLALLWPSHSERGTGLGAPMLYFDAYSGELLYADVPGHGSRGDTLLQLQFPLHSGQIAGTPGKLAIAAAGLAVAMLSVTGVVVWNTKRAARRAARGRTPPR